jgi:hypothetical protein
MNLIDRMFPKLPDPGATPSTAPPTAAAGGASTVAGPGAVPVSPSELVERRRALQERFAELQWNLGGLAYEMAIRDHFRLDVLVRLAAELQQVDAELGEVERLLRLEQAGAAGACPSCDALYGRGAVYCWQCGTSLMPQAPVAAAPVAS